MIDTFFDVKKILMIKEKIRAKPKPAAPKGGKQFKESQSQSPAKSKSPAAKKPDDKTKSSDKKIEKPSYTIRP